MPFLTGCLFALAATSGFAGGITADVGLTPPQDRFIFRTQIRYMERGDDPTSMNRTADMIAMPLVLALVREWRGIGASFSNGIHQGRRAILEDDPPFAGNLVTIVEEFVG